MTVALNGAASSSSSGAYAPVATAFCMCASRASADSQSAISTRTSGASSTSCRVLPKEAVLAWSLGRDDALEQTTELVPPTWFGLQLDDHFDGHVAVPGRLCGTEYLTEVRDGRCVGWEVRVIGPINQIKDGPFALPDDA